MYRKVKGLLKLCWQSIKNKKNASQLLERRFYLLNHFPVFVVEMVF